MLLLGEYLIIQTYFVNFYCPMISQSRHISLTFIVLYCHTPDIFHELLFLYYADCVSDLCHMINAFISRAYSLNISRRSPDNRTFT